jgi:hypothetical protein
MTDLVEAARRAGEFRLHPLGFFYLQTAAGEGKTFRVHVWLPDGPNRPENDRHQHSFDIESFVAAGRMHSELFQFEEMAGGPDAEYAVTYDGQESILRPSGRRGMLVPIASFETVAGSGYRLEAGVIHRVAVMHRPCISVVRTLERGVPIFSYGHEDEALFDRRLCTTGEAELIKRHLVEVAER